MAESAVHQAELAALHQMRISQVPLRSSDDAYMKAHHEIRQQEDHGEGLVEKLSSLDHVRYNIVCKLSGCFVLSKLFAANLFID